MKDKLSDSELTSLVLLFTAGTTLLFGAGSVAREDSWISVIISIFIMIPIAKMYCKLLKLYPLKDLFEIFELICGKWIGKALIIIYFWFSTHSATLTIFNSVDFITFVSLHNTPLLILVTIFSVLFIYIVKKGIKVIGKLSVFFVFISFVLGWAIVFMLFPLHNYENIKPISSQGFNNIYLGVISVVTTSFSGLIIFTFFGESYKSPERFEKVFIKAVVLAGGIILILSLEDVLVLGVENNLRAHFPGYERYTRIQIGNWFQRSESVMSGIYIVSEFLRGSLFVFSGTKALQRLFKLNNFEICVTPVVMSSVNLCFIEYQSILVGLEFLIEVWPYYSGVVNILIPLAFFITAYIKKYLKLCRRFST